MNPSVPCSKTNTKRGAGLRPAMTSKHGTKRYTRTIADCLVVRFAKGKFYDSKNSLSVTALVFATKIVADNRADQCAAKGQDFGKMDIFYQHDTNKTKTTDYKGYGQKRGGAVIHSMRQCIGLSNAAARPA